MAALSNVDLCSKYPKILGRSGTYAGSLAGRCMSVLWQLAREKLAASKDLLVVGAYPHSGSYDECRTSAAEHDRALTTIPKVALPRKDPVYGREGPLMRLWRQT